MELERAIRTRRTTKAFGDEPVDPAILAELVELATWAPNHHLTNPWRFRVLGPGARTRLEQAAGPEGAVKLRRAPTLVAVTSRRTPGVLHAAPGRAALGIGEDQAFVALDYIGPPRQDSPVPERAPLDHILIQLD